MLLRNRAKRSRRQGVTTLEFALVIPVFFLFILSLIEIGRAMMVVNLLNNAARAGCREAVLPGKTDSDVSAKVTQVFSKQGMRDVTTTVKVNNVVQNCSSAQSKDEITVTIIVPVAKNTWVPGANLITGNLTGQYTMPRE